MSEFCHSSNSWNYWIGKTISVPEIGMKPSRKMQISAPPLTDAQVVQQAEQLTDDFLRIVGPRHVRINGLRFEDVYEELIRPRYGITLVDGIDFGQDENGREILGNYDVEKNTAFISSVLSADSGDGRRFFTLWHEVGGHGVLQGQWLRDELQKCVIVTAESLTSATGDRLERQANVFAAHAAGPGWLVRQAVLALTGREQFPFYEANDYCLTVNGLPIRRYIVDFNHLCQWIAHQIAGWFGG